LQVNGDFSTQGERAGVATPSQVSVWIGLDVGKETHFADGELDRIFARRDALAMEIEEAFLAHPFGEILASLPGIGPRTGAGSSPRSATARTSPAAPGSPPTPGSRP
jgi:hypothetical protein